MDADLNLLYQQLTTAVTEYFEKKKDSDGLAVRKDAMDVNQILSCLIGYNMASIIKNEKDLDIYLIELLHETMTTVREAMTETYEALEEKKEE